MEFKGNLTRLAGACAALAFGSTLLVGGASSAQAAPVYYQVHNANNSRLCLQLNISAGKGNVILGDCNRSASVVWTISGGIFRNPVSGHCLDGNGADVYTFPCNGGAYQQWSNSASPTYIKHAWSDKYLTARGIPGEEVAFATSTATSSRWVIEQLP
ncbi:ricin-type beta-trefoil lectin domain protein [Amycolatopsis sp. NPDC021455]|uniref:RICIN domain-containing protein n=1 Tax=Amycolatopsis sp. NPDC021455 TaxID=3154901 RepID=UPI00340EB9EF